jgi:putative transposase
LPQRPTSASTPGTSIDQRTKASPSPSITGAGIRYGERLAEFGAVPSIGSVGDSFDNALAETVIGLYKTELIRGPDQGPWRTIDDVELATLGWVHWYNTERLHGYLDDVPPDVADVKAFIRWAASSAQEQSNSSEDTDHSV